MLLLHRGFYIVYPRYILLPKFLRCKQIDCNNCITSIFVLYMNQNSVLYLYPVWWWPGFLHTQDQHGWPRGQVHPQPGPGRCWGSDCRPGGDLLLEEVYCPPLCDSTGLPLHHGHQRKQTHFSCVSHLIATVCVNKSFLSSRVGKPYAVLYFGNILPEDFCRGYILLSLQEEICFFWHG